jgi:hypothetical protein
LNKLGNIALEDHVFAHNRGYTVNGVPFLGVKTQKEDETERSKNKAARTHAYLAPQSMLKPGEAPDRCRLVRLSIRWVYKTAPFSRRTLWTTTS